MSNKYSRWAPTQYVELPIDYYQSAALVKEQRTQEAMDQLDNIIKGYGSIKPLGADAQALYDETIGTIKQRTDDIAKMQLDTPKAKREIQKILTDPTTVKNLTNIYQDAMLGAEEKKKYDEYLKKNPQVNAIGHAQAFRKLGMEKGDAKNFDPNRFRSLGPLVDYVDSHKAIADEVSKMKENETELQRVLGPYYRKYKESGVGEDRIIEHATRRVLSDPIHREQFNRNMQYSFYQRNPDDINAGKAAIANDFRTNAMEKYNEFQIKASQLTKGKTADQIKKDPKLTSQLSFYDRMMKQYRDVYDRDPNTGDYKMNDDDLVSRTSLNAFAESFRGYGNRKTSDIMEFNPKYLRELDHAFRWRLQERKMQAQADMIKQATQSMPLTSVGTRQNDAITPNDFKDYLSTKMAGALPNLVSVMGSDGSVTPKGATKAYEAVTIGGEGTSSTRYFTKGELFYDDPGAKDAQLNKPPNGYVKVGRAKGPFSGQEVDVWAPKTSKPLNELPKDGGGVYGKAINELRAYINNSSTTGNLAETAFNNLKNPEDIKNAVQAVVNNKRITESTYSTIYTLPSGNTPTMRKTVANHLPNVKVTYEDGSDVSAEDLAAAQTALFGNKANIDFQVYDKHHSVPVYSIAVNGKTIKAPMHMEFQQMLASSRHAIDNIVTSKSNVTDVGGNDWMISGMGANGMPLNAVFEGAKLPAYQATAKQAFESNVKAMVDAGWDRTTAVSYIKGNIESIKSNIATKNSHEAVNPTTGKKAILKYAVSYQQGPKDPIYYLFNDIKIGNEVYRHKALGDHLMGTMGWFGSSDNPYMIQPNWDHLKSRGLSEILGNFGNFEDGSDDFPDY